MPNAAYEQRRKTAHSAAKGSAKKINRGAALVSVLWLLMLLSTVVLSLSRETQLATKTTQVYAHELQARSLVEGGVYESVFWLLVGRPTTELLRKMESSGLEIKLYEIEDQTDLNAASRAQIEALLRKYKITEYETLAGRIVDFRHQDAAAHSKAALSAGKEYTQPSKSTLRKAKRRDLKHVLELAQVQGISLQTIETLGQDITVFGGKPSGRAVSLTIATTYKSTRVQANVTVRFTGDDKKPYKILSWDWTAS